MSTSRLNQLFVLLTDSPDDLFLLYAIALEYIALNQRDDAEKYFLKILATDANYLPVYYQIVEFYQPVNPEKAIEYCKKGIKLAMQTGKHKTQSELRALLEQLEDE